MVIALRRCEAPRAPAERFRPDAARVAATRTHALRQPCRCHAREGGHPVTTILCSSAPQGLLDRPVKPGDDNSWTVAVP